MLQGDAETVRVAVAQSGGALSYASAALQGDAEIVRVAVAQNGGALSYEASAALQGDAETVRVAVAQSGGALQYASDEMKARIDVIIVAVAQGPDHCGSYSHWLTEALGADPTVQRLRHLVGDERALPHALLRLGLFGHLQHLPRMLDEGITVAMLPTLGYDDLKELGMATLGKRKAFIAAAKLPEDVPPEDMEPEPEPEHTFATSNFKREYDVVGLVPI